MTNTPDPKDTRPCPPAQRTPHDTNATLDVVSRMNTNLVAAIDSVNRSNTTLGSVIDKMASSQQEFVKLCGELLTQLQAAKVPAPPPQPAPKPPLARPVIGSYTLPKR